MRLATRLLFEEAEEAEARDAAGGGRITIAAVGTGHRNGYRTAQLRADKRAIRFCDAATTGATRSARRGAELPKIQALLASGVIASCAWSTGTHRSSSRNSPGSSPEQTSCTDNPNRDINLGECKISARPIFVLGRHRSGTTWLSNIIASLPEVYAPMHELHRGVHESAFFSHLVPYCNGGRTTADLLAIKHLFERSDYFLLTGLDEGPDIIRHGYAEYFRLVMEAAARRSGARFWLEKTPSHTLLAKFLLQSYPDAILLAVVRNPREVVASNVHGFGKPRSPWAWFRQAAVTAIYEKIIARHEVFVVRYEDLRDHHLDTVRSIALQLDVNSEGVPENRFERNTSYEGDIPAVKWWQITAMECGRLLVRLSPGILIETAVYRWRSKKAGFLPDWFFLMSSRGIAVE